MQSVLAIPFPIFPVDEPAGQVAPSANGAFEASFAVDAPGLPTNDCVADSTVLGLFVVPSLPLALLPALAGQGLDADLGKMTTEARGHIAGGMAEGGLQSLTFNAAEAIGLPSAVELQVLADVGPQDVASVSGASASNVPKVWNDPIAPDPAPIALDAILTGNPDQQPVASLAPVLPAAVMPEVARATKLGRSGVADASSIAVPRSSPVDYEPGGMISGLTAYSPVAGMMASTEEPMLQTEPDARAPAMTDRKSDVGQALAMPRGEPLPAKASLSPSEPASQGVASDILSVRPPVPPTLDSADGGPALRPDVRDGRPGGDDLAKTPLPMEMRVASTGIAPALVAPEAKALVRPGTLPSDVEPEAEDPRVDVPDRLPASTLQPPATPPGFWERLFTGLTVAEAEGNMSPGTATDAEAGPGFEAEPLHAIDRLAPALPDLPTSGARLASGLVVFARGLELQASPSDKIAPKVEAGELTAFSLPLLSGTPIQNLSQSAATTSGPLHLPVPQVAAQITTALSQTADGATELALSPEELGRVRLRLERDASNPERMVVHITFERPETLDLFRRHAGELTEALRDAGYAGTDIGFGHEGSSADTPKRDPGVAAFDHGFDATGTSDSETADPSAPRLLAGASLDLRL